MSQEQETAVALEVAPTKEKKKLRASSPARLPTELLLKYRAQLTRIEDLESLAALPEEPGALVSLVEVETWSEQARETLAEFKKEHSYLESSWPATFIDHPYFKDNALQKATKTARALIGTLNKLRDRLTPDPAVEALTNPAHSLIKPPLPEITIPKFAGVDSEWPAFRDLFTQVIMNNPGLADIQKLHYLRGSLREQALQLINNLPLVETSLKPSWELLTTRYENRRRFLQSQLDRLNCLPSTTSKDPLSVARLEYKAAEVYQALKSLCSDADMGEVMFVHHIVRHLDREAREAWELSLGNSQEFPRFSQLDEYLVSRARALDAAKTATRTASPTRSTQPRKPTPVHSLVASTSTQRKDSDASGPRYQCDCCDEPHFIVTCPKFRAMSVKDRRSLVKIKRLCYNCVGRHSAPACRSTLLCKTCRDPGSELTFVTEVLITQLRIQRQHSSFPIIGVAGTWATHTRGVASLTLRSFHSRSVVDVRAHILKKVTTVLPSSEVPPQTWPHLKNLKLADPDFLKPRAVDIILGADFYGQVIKPNLIKHSPFSPIAQLSIFGWLVLGPVGSAQSAGYVHNASAHSDNVALQQLLAKFWEQEEFPSDEPGQLTPEEQECEDYFVATHTRDSSGRYTVRIPLKTSSQRLGDSYDTAFHCLQRIIKRFQRDSEFERLYHAFMAEYLQLGHMVSAVNTPAGTTRRQETGGSEFASRMTLAPDASVSGGLRVLSGSSSPPSITHPACYLPHHGVLKPDSATTKLRVVFNGSSPTSSGSSVNDIMHTGANLLLDIKDVLFWIRHHRHIFATDITKMYRQINVHPDDWDLQRILWVDEAQRVTPYYLTTVTYGTKSAPFLAGRTLIQLAKDEGSRFPLAVPSITHGRYVDDMFGGADTLTQLTDIAHQLVSLCHAGGFPLAKWLSSHPDLLKTVSSSDLTDSDIKFDNCTAKILGLKWLPHSDSFVFTSSFEDRTEGFSKRLILSEVAQIFDPLGFISPVVIRAKMLLQELWLHNLNWDDSLPPQLASRWINIREDLTDLDKITIPRWFNTWSDSTVEIHGFSDASKLAMASVVYLVIRSPSTGAKTSLVISKTKVAPLKKLTIPRLELTAALLLAKLIRYTRATLNLKIEATHLWTDSQVTLTWIKTPASRWKEYVRNRVSQIQELTSEAHWRHVPGTSNPADCASRGLTAQQLKDHSLWWTGPPWMSQPADTWPAQPEMPADLGSNEARPGMALFVAAPKMDYHWDLIHRYSSLDKLIRITALCFRIQRRLRGIPDSTPVTIIPPMDMEQSRLFWVKSTQAVYFAPELKILCANQPLPKDHSLSRLTAFVDHQGIMRVGGRLNLSALTYEEKHPAILPRHSRFTALVIDQAHRRTFHGGTQLTLAYTRHLYWIVGGRAPVKSHVLRCIPCARQRGIRAQQLMGQLPHPRVTPSRPFMHTGVDYAGPITFKSHKGRGGKLIKGWMCIFVCFSTSAVHLETVSDYSSDGFIAAYRRFTSRRGIPHTIYSDCGTNFVGADAILQRLFIQSSQEHHVIAAILAQDKTHWKFNPPAAPHMGGKWESVVKLIKFHLRRTLGDTTLTFEEHSTLLTQIEATLNSRPLEALSDDPEDVLALTPGHFLIGSALSTVPEPSLTDLNVGRLSRWQLIQQRLQQFWSHWSSHYLQHHLSISKWHHPSNDIKVGSLVLITDERLPPSKWPLARVTQLHPGKDGLTRIVTLKTATTTLTRPVTKLAPLPLHQGNSSSTP